MKLNITHIEVAVALLVVAIGFALTYNTDDRWIGHGILSIVGLILVIEIIVTGAMNKGRLKGTNRTNLFKLHKTISILFGFFMVGTFVYGLWITSMHDEPLLTSAHGQLGLIIVIIAILQVIPSLIVKRRNNIRFPHMILGYAEAFLVAFQVTLGINFGLLEIMEIEALMYSALGGVAASALTWIVVKMLISR